MTTAAAKREVGRMPGRVAEHIAATAATALLDELETWPKPGLVSHLDCGSHADMDASTFRASIRAITPYFGRLALAGAGGSGMDALRQIGLEAEGAMLAKTGGANTHRGAIFGLGLLCAAAGGAWSGTTRNQSAWGAGALCAAVRRNWGSAILSGPIPLRSHGTEALRRFGASGARGEAAAGFPHAIDIGLPALRLGRALAPADPEAARVQSFFSILATIEDTNLLYRGGGAGLRFARERAAGFLSKGGVGDALWRGRAAAVHRAFVAHGLSPGGCADVLGITLFLDALEAGV